MTIGRARWGAAIYGAVGTLDHDIAEPEPEPELPWDPDAPTPEDPPAAEPTVPELIFELVERNGVHVAWLDKSYARGWRRDRSQPGSATVTVQRDSPVAPELVAPRMLRARYRGVVAQDALISPRTDRAAQKGEAAAQSFTLAGAGRIMVLDDGLVGPWSETSRPTADSQRFNCHHPDFELTTDWIAATELARQDATTEHWTGLPANWPGSGAEKWIAAPGDTTDDTTYTVAVDYYGRRKTTLPGGRYAACFTADDIVELHIDGIRQGEARTFHGFERVDLHLSAGTHTFSAKWTNIKQLPTNPIGFLFSLMPVEAATGRLGAPVLVSDSSWRILPNPDEVPGWKLGRIVRYVLQRFRAKGGPPVFRGFTDDLDTDGDPWPTLPDLTVSATSSVAQFVQQISESYVDAFMVPGTTYPNLRLWNKGSRGSTLATEFGSGFEAVALPSLKSLDVDIEPPYATSILGHWGDGWVRRSRSVPGWFIERPFEVPNVLTRAEVVRTLDELLDIFGQERKQYRLEVYPRSDAQRPHVTGGFNEADRIVVVLDGQDVTVPVESIEGKLDANGLVAVTVEAGDLLLDEEERIKAWLQAMEAGAFGGRSTQPTSTRLELPRQQTTTVKRPLRFHRPTSVTTVLGAGDTVEETGRIVAWVATVDPVQGSGVDVELYIDGVDSGVTATVPAGARAGRARCNIPVTQDVTFVQPRCTATGFELVAKAILE